MSAPQDLLPLTTPPGNREFDSFTSLRTDVVFELYDAVEQIHQGGNILDIQSSLFEARHKFAFDLIIENSENLQNIGRCFRMRCDLITRTMDQMIALLAREPNQQKMMFAADVMNMLALQVGRLTLHGITGEDPSAELEDDRSLETKEWYTAIEANPDKAELDSIWARLQMVHPVCTCQQCRRRNRHTVPR